MCVYIFGLGGPKKRFSNEIWREEVKQPLSDGHIHCRLLACSPHWREAEIGTATVLALPGFSFSLLDSWAECVCVFSSM